MARYHYNPSTGESGQCRAKAGNCPFLAEGARHFDTKEGARRGYEEFQEAGFQSLTAQLMVTRARLQRQIIELFTKKQDEPLSSEQERLLRAMADERSSIESAIKNSSKDFPHTASVKGEKPKKVIYEEIADDRGTVVIGISNVEEELVAKAPQTARALVNISEEWLSRLSTEEAHAVWNYALDPNSANGKGEILSEAIEKAPTLEPTKVFSGLSNHVARDVMSQVASGKVTLDYPISTSMNPAQVNGFMGKFEGLVAQPGIALEIETTVGGSMASASHALYEFEILLPAGTYEVVEERKDVKFLWSEDGVGREADHFIKLRRVD
jgi:hypothetical protein